MITVYLDVHLVTNILVNYILLKISSRLGKISYNNKRVVLSSLVGALFATFIFLELNPVISLVLRSVSLLLCSYIAYGFINTKNYIRNTGILFFSTAFFSGTVLYMSQKSEVFYFNNFLCYININPVLLVMCITLAYVVINIYGILYSKSVSGEKQECEIEIEGRKILLSAFYDTGFSVRDILGHRAVMLCSMQSVNGVMPLELYIKLKDFLSGNITGDKNIVCIFYSDISGSGILPAIVPDRVVINNHRIENILIAFTEQSFDKDTDVIFGKDIFDMAGR
ncbi:MAG: sigma-E processing peptidase SpoIIGA [Oscillospiraceae bacterium]|nr:sigma-E processing peptidase SpoIIGA [Oscillospiraceae bacterium]